MRGGEVEKPSPIILIGTVAPGMLPVEEVDGMRAKVPCSPGQCGVGGNSALPVPICVPRPWEPVTPACQTQGTGTLEC